MDFVKYVLTGIGIGLVFGIFGAGGSAFATPVLSVLGVPALIAVASPLPAMIPAAFAGASRYLRSGNLDRRVAKISILSGVPGTLLGAITSRLVGGQSLLVLSGLLLLILGARLVIPSRATGAARAADRRNNTSVVATSTFGVGFMTGLLANGGGFLLVPLYVLILGMSATEAAGTSMVVVGVLTIPTLATHWALGHVNWTVAAGFALGLIPASLIGARLAQRIPANRARTAFGSMLVVFAVWFLVRMLR